MNRRKKLTQALKKKRQAANAKLSTKQKSSYVSKADREPDKGLEQANPPKLP